MKDFLTNHPASTAVGFIHFSCFCGLEIYCLGISADGTPPLKAMGKLKVLLDGQPAALFSTNEGTSTSCPNCGIELELPSEEVLAGFAHRIQTQDLGQLFGQGSGQILEQPDTSSTRILPPGMSRGT